jgi:arylsulfatase A-like enzyme
MVRAVDDAVGRIVDGLDEQGLSEDTLLVVTTDHGIGFPRAMGTLYDPGVETFLIARWPGVIEPATDDHLISGVDICPTLLDIANCSVPDDLDGRTFQPLLTGDAETYRPRERIFLEQTWHSKYAPIRAVRTERRKYIRNYGDQPDVYIPAPIFSAPSGREMRAEYYATEKPEEELYDLERDPLERQNLIESGNSNHDGILEDSRAELDSWLDRTADPIRDGPWPPTAEQRERVQKSPWIPKRVGH